MYCVIKTCAFKFNDVFVRNKITFVYIIIGGRTESNKYALLSSIITFCSFLESSTPVLQCLILFKLLDFIRQ